MFSSSVENFLRFVRLHDSVSESNTVVRKKNPRFVDWYNIYNYSEENDIMHYYMYHVNEMYKSII